jgi:hypothetical protein
MTQIRISLIRGYTKHFVTPVNDRVMLALVRHYNSFIYNKLRDPSSVFPHGTVQHRNVSASTAVRPDTTGFQPSATLTHKAIDAARPCSSKATITLFFSAASGAQRSKILEGTCTRTGKLLAYISHLILSGPPPTPSTMETGKA